jgi:hypothetical protein
MGFSIVADDPSLLTTPLVARRKRRQPGALDVHELFSLDVHELSFGVIMFRQTFASRSSVSPSCGYGKTVWAISPALVQYPNTDWPEPNL